MLVGGSMCVLVCNGWEWMGSLLANPTKGANYGERLVLACALQLGLLPCSVDVGLPSDHGSLP